jgi:predicted phosphodiesterase
VRVHILSDLHLEFAPFTPAPVDAEVVVLAGDIATGVRGIEWAAHTFRGLPVVYVLGNHEFYGQTAPDLVRKAQQHGAELGVHVLSDDSVMIGEVRFLGATLWTDFRLFGNSPSPALAAQQGMTDFRRIRVSPRYRKLRPADTTLWHVRSRRWLTEALHTSVAGPTIVVTHHAPSIRSVAPHFASEELSAAYASDLEELVRGCGATLWVHGHTHHNVDYFLGHTRVVSNQRGYPDEPVRGFDPSQSFDV